MWVEGFEGIDRSQLISFRFKRDDGHYGQEIQGEKYFYIKFIYLCIIIYIMWYDFRRQQPLDIHRSPFGPNNYKLFY